MGATLVDRDARDDAPEPEPASEPAAPEPAAEAIIESAAAEIEDHPPLDASDARDRRLVRRARSGDARAFEELVHHYQHRIFGLTLRMIGNRQEAEDLAQEVFITVHRALASYRGEGRFYTWLYRIATNTCKNRIKYLRGRNFHRSVADDSPEAQAAAPEGGPQMPLQSQIAGPEAMAEGSRLEAAIQAELAQLEPEHRLLIVLRDVQGMSYQDILRITGLQEGTLKSRLHRARLALKERLRPYMR
ncbi:MAG: sigma-70 family RNA polymerase sigma factor [Deltaproteobacteria bacterium]|nr:sigma-70 family RNA polymerase sigma factor [Nannocystaceae bacterium]